MEPHVAIKFDVLAGVKRIKARGPEDDAQPQYDRCQCKSAGYGDPAGHRRHAQGQAEQVVAKGCEPFGVGVAQEDHQGERRQFAAQGVDGPRSRQKNGN